MAVIFGAKKQLTELYDLLNDVGGGLDRSLDQVHGKIDSMAKELERLSSSLLHLQREAEARKLELDRLRDAKTNAEAALAETQRGLQQANSDLVQRHVLPWRQRDAG